ncbi:ClpP/crotonase [Nadsonia fulvescens var. elongata DSM 6958]|uniref:Probable enoyl-CoA hydratase, mitochondrial n=1 Tax=Nadsonia fulvescens var. elongata DSM 6958 TaxID=857566 RepID=A0A1E3PDQ1_9ASCO|nr:ClpP/crotonase [Nadsonia fulvescens var. elongata DSM 6958]
MYATSIHPAQYEHLIVSVPQPGVQLIELNRPKALNALNSALISEINLATAAADRDGSIGAIVLTGSTSRAFAAGADIKEMKDKTFAEAYSEDFIANWNDLTRIRKPVLAAVNGYALGGGCELAMMADIIYAGDKAVFGQPEIKLGVIPGAGGTQRLPKLVGKVRATELILTGRNFSAVEAEKWGLVARIFPAEQLVDEVVKVAQEIAGYGGLAVKAAKESINEGLLVSLDEGLKYERKLFHGLFSTKDKVEGMTAFVEKRQASFKGE